MVKDNDKFRELFERSYSEHFYKVKYFARQYLNDDENANNVAQDVFLSFWENIQNIDENGNILSYLLTTAKNKSLNILSKESYRQKYANDAKYRMISEINLSLLKEDVTTHLLSVDVYKILSKAFDKMQDAVRNTFVLCKLQRYKQKKAASILNVSEKTIEVRLKKAMIIIRKEFSHYVPLLVLFFIFHLYIK